MLTFSTPDGSSILVQGKSKTLLFFSKKDSKGPKADVLLFGVPDEEPAEGTISWPGEYDIDGISIRGIGQNAGGNVSYVIEAEDIRCAFIGTPLLDWTDHEQELLGDVAVLAIQGDDPKKVQKILEEIDPRIVIPLKAEGAPFAEILKICGSQAVEPVKEFKLKGPSQLPQEGRQVVVFE